MPDTPELASVFFLYAETPVHAGASEGRAALDLPIQRSVQTGWPILNDSTVRGGLRGYIHSKKGAAKAKEYFGSEEGDDRHPGSFSTPDAETLLFPVAAAQGLTAWVTCPLALEYFVRKLNLIATRLAPAAQDAILKLQGITIPGLGDTEACVATECKVRWAVSGPVILESDHYTVRAGDVGEKIAEWISMCAIPFPTNNFWRMRVKKHFALISDAAFQHYVLRKTDVRTRIALSEGIAENLFTEENLPVDTLLYTLLAATGSNGNGEHLKNFCADIETANRPVIQLGGDQSLGRGLLRVKKLGEA